MLKEKVWWQRKVVANWLKSVLKECPSKRDIAKPKSQKSLDIKHKMCYNVYEKRKENLTNQKGNYYEEIFPAIPRFPADQLR